MNPYQALIDRTTFGIVADYLRNPRSPIDYILHVRDRSRLAPLAESLERISQSSDDPSRDVTVLLESHCRQGLLRISARRPLAVEHVHVVDSLDVPRLAPADVIYLPPYYLSHTPGLFEGTLLRIVRETEQRPGLLQPRRGPGMKP